MRNKEIKNELLKIYKERKCWNGARGLFTYSEEMNRKLILLKQWALYNLQEAKALKDEKKELFYFEIYKIINKYLRR